MTDSTQELDEILKEHWGRLDTYAELYRKHHHNPSRHQADIDHAHNIAKQAIEAYVTTRVKEALLEVKKAGENWEEPNEGTKYELDKKLKALTTTTKDEREQ